MKEKSMKEQAAVKKHEVGLPVKKVPRRAYELFEGRRGVRRRDVDNWLVLEDAGVDYCCGGGRSLQEACVNSDVQADAVPERLRQNSEEPHPQEAQWTLSGLTLHIQTIHHRHVREAIVRIRTALTEVATKHGTNHPEISLIQRLFTELGQELIMHMQKEEQIVFSYIDGMEKAYYGVGSVEPPFFQTVKNPIRAMTEEHDAAQELVRQIRKATSEYRPPADACMSYKALYQELRQFEANLHRTVHLENNILFPRAAEMERAVFA
jgi:regulator of cell morphogenesis and NO signaling